MISALCYRFNPFRHINRGKISVSGRNEAQLRTLAGIRSENDPISRRSISYQSNKSTDITPTFKNAPNYGQKIAIKDEFGQFSYQQIYNGAVNMSLEISKICGKWLGFSKIKKFHFNSRFFTVFLQAPLIILKSHSSARIQHCIL